MKQKNLLLMSAVVAACSAPSCWADVSVVGRVVEGGKSDVGIYWVSVEVRQGERLLCSGKTDEDGRFDFVIKENAPLPRLIARFSKASKVPFAIMIKPAGTYSLPTVSLIPEGANNEYLMDVATAIYQEKKKTGSNKQVLSGYSSVFNLPDQSKAQVLSRIKVLDPELYASMSQADEANVRAASWQKELRKRDPSVEVMPDFTLKNAVIVNGVPKKSSELHNWQKAGALRNLN